MNKRILALVCGVAAVLLAFLLSFTVAKNAEYKKLKAQKPVDPTPTNPVTTTNGSESVTGGSEATTADEQETEAPEETTYTISDDTVLPEPEVVNMPTDENWSIVLLNKFYKMNEEYEPFLALVHDNENFYLDERVAEKYKEMEAAAKADGITLTLSAAYISPDRQMRLFEKEVSNLILTGMSEEEAKAKAAFTVLPVNCNEANYGLSVEIGWPEGDFSGSPAYAWLRSHAAYYGFIERYTASGEKITHFNALPYHWRYVGKDAAQYIRDNNITLEEYVGKVN